MRTSARHLGVLLAFALGCVGTKGPANGQNDFGGAVVSLASGVAGAGIYRATTGGCWSSCYPGTQCEPKSGTCVPVPCGGKCGVDEVCQPVSGKDACVPRSRPDRPAGGVTAADPAAGAPVTPFEEGGKWGFRDERGRVAIAATYVHAYPFNERGVAHVLESSEWSCIDAKGVTLLHPFTFDNGPDYEVEGLARFVEGGKIGYFDESCKARISPDYDFGAPFSEGRAAVCRGCREVKDGEHTIVRGGKWGFIDKAGKLVVPLHLEEADAFSDARARVRVGGRERVIDRDGNYVK